MNRYPIWKYAILVVAVLVGVLYTLPNFFGEAPAVRMIDGQPAFPDEVPEPGWRELRVGLAGGMVTLRRTGSEVRVVTWGTADPVLTRSWDRLCWAVAAAGEGELLSPGGPQSAADFRSSILGG